MTIERSAWSLSEEAAQSSHVAPRWRWAEDLLFVGDVLGAALYSVFVEKLTVDVGKAEPYEVNPPWLNTILFARKGSLKSAQLKMCERLLPDRTVVTMDLTHAGLVGSIYEEEATIPFAWMGNGKAKLVDELAFQRDDGKLIGALLKLSLGEEYSRTISYPAKRPVKQRVGDSWWTVENGTISLKTRGPFVFATMKTPEFYARSSRLSALQDRCLICKYRLSQGQLLKLGKHELEFGPRIFNSDLRTVSVPHSDYLKLYELWKNNTAGDANLRLLDDLYRLYAVFGYIEPSLFEAILRHNTPVYVREEE